MIQAWLNGDFFNNSFTAAEQAAIVQSYQGNTGAKDSLNGDRVFLLTADDVENNRYGYYKDPNVAYVSCLLKSEDRSDWWLRSPDSDGSMVRGVFGYGYILPYFADEVNVGVSPAFNVNVASVIFSSLIPHSSNEYKLTLKDNSLSVYNIHMSRNGNEITISYETGGSPTRLSIVMTAGTWDYDEETWSPGASVRYYGQLSDGKFTLPDDYNDSWSTYIFAEKVNPGTATDYAGEPTGIIIPEADNAETGVVPGISHVHNLTLVPANAPTETLPGNKAYYVCSGCGKFFEDEAGAKEITDRNSVVIPPTGKRTPETDEPVYHTHNLATARWKVTREATPAEDGEISLFCMECGEVLDIQPLSGYYAFLVDSGKKIRNALPGAEVVISTNKWISFNGIVLDELKARPDVKVVVDYRYEGQMWEVVIPAGTDVDALKNEEGYAGFELLAGMFGKREMLE